ncbi:MAG: D-alanine--D-alanine ligase [Candidatus Kaiserbacteria bacterium]|nr:D-alanine--D-alanine ligase [Candidatus Kaiserbacteria bacterium]
MSTLEDIQDKTIGVFFGGQSPEHEISIITGEFVIAEMKKMGLTVVAVYVGRDGAWYSDEKIAKLAFFKGEYKKALAELPEYYLNLGRSEYKLALQQKGIFGAGKTNIEYIFPAFHGLYGEDGTVQGLAEFFQVPYAGCGIYTSAIAVDKVLTKRVLHALDIPTTDFLVVQKQEYDKGADAIEKQIHDTLGLPVFVKPARSGSSIGITKVKEVKDLRDALNLALYYDPKVVVEQSVEDVADVTCAVLSDGEGIHISEVQESLFTADLFDYSVKYLEDGGAQTGNAESNLVIPATISPEHTAQVKDISKQLFTTLEANGTLRVDFLLNKKTGELFANEVNTLPGTLYHHLWKKSGIDINVVLEMMLKDGMCRWNESREIHDDYATEVLTNANQAKLQQG